MQNFNDILNTVISESNTSLVPNDIDIEWAKKLILDIGSAQTKIEKDSRTVMTLHDKTNNTELIKCVLVPKYLKIIINNELLTHQKSDEAVMFKIEKLDDAKLKAIRMALNSFIGSYYIARKDIIQLQSGENVTGLQSKIKNDKELVQVKQKWLNKVKAVKTDLYKLAK